MVIATVIGLMRLFYVNWCYCQVMSKADFHFLRLALV